MNGSKLWVLSCLIGVLGVLFVAPAAEAAKCGTAPVGKKGKPLAAGLEFDEQGSTTSLNFGKGTGEKKLILAFAVTGCELKRNTPVRAVPISSDLSESTFGEAKIEVDPTSVEVRMPVVADEFDPGKYSGAIKVLGPGVITTVQGISVQRSQTPFWPSFTAIIAAILGIVFAYFAANTNVESGKKLKPTRVFIAILPALTAAAAVWKTSYTDAEVWNAEFFSYVVLFLAVTAASLGAATPALVGEDAKTTTTT